MGREVRRVPADWQHPRDARGSYIPLAYFDEETLVELQGDYDWLVEEYGVECANKRYRLGRPSRERDYMPEWPASEATHYQMYETCTEGTPISPPCESPEQLARWLADNGASAFAGMTASYEDWLATIRRGDSPAAMISGAGIQSGVQAMAELERSNEK